MQEENFLEDINLWKRLLKDDRDALSLLFRKYYKPLLNYGLRLIPREELVKDSIQELFFTIWDKRDRLSDIEYVSSYLYTSFRRTLFKQADMQKIRQQRDAKYSEEQKDQEITAEQRLIIEEIRHEKKANLREAFESLNDSQKEAAFLKFYNGLTNDEISEVMGVKKESVYNYIYRAISALQEKLNISLTG